MCYSLSLVCIAVQCSSDEEAADEDAADGGSDVVLADDSENGDSFLSANEVS